MTSDIEKKDANRDPITGTPGAHPLGTGVGAAAGGAAAGAVVGTMAGPVGTAVGAAIGAVAGGLAGKAVAEKIDPTVEDAYWRENHEKETYYNKARTYDDYQPAYRAGYEGRQRYTDQSFEQAEPNLRSDYEAEKASRVSAGTKRRTPRAPPGIASSAPSPGTPIATAVDRILGRDAGRPRFGACHFATTRPESEVADQRRMDPPIRVRRRGSEASGAHLHQPCMFPGRFRRHRAGSLGHA